MNPLVSVVVPIKNMEKYLIVTDTTSAMDREFNYETIL